MHQHISAQNDHIVLTMMYRNLRTLLKQINFIQDSYYLQPRRKWTKQIKHNKTIAKYKQFTNLKNSE